MHFKRNNINNNSNKGQGKETLPSSSGLAKRIICLGNTSGTPPTLVLTTKRPAQAASTIPIQNASVKLVFKKICPRTKVYCQSIKILVSPTSSDISVHATRSRYTKAIKSAHIPDLMCFDGSQELDTVVK